MWLMKLSSNGKVKVIKIKFSVLFESYFSPSLTQAGHFLDQNQVSGMVISFTCVFLCYFSKTSLPIHQNYLKDWKLYSQRFLKYPQILYIYILLNRFRNSLTILYFESIYIIIYSELLFPLQFLLLLLFILVCLSHPLTVMCLPHHLGKSCSDE